MVQGMTDDLVRPRALCAVEPVAWTREIRRGSTEARVRTYPDSMVTTRAPLRCRYSTPLWSKRGRDCHWGWWRSTALAGPV